MGGSLTNVSGSAPSQARPGSAAGTSAPRDAPEASGTCEAPRDCRLSRTLRASTLPDVRWAWLSAGGSAAGAAELLVDNGLELRERDRAVEGDSVHEEGRGSGHAGRRTRGHVVADHLRVLARLEAGVERLRVELQLLRVALERVHPQRLLVVEELVVHLPELVLVMRTHRGLAGLLRVRVEVEREVAEDHAHLLGVGLHDLFDDRPSACAVGALEVAELDDGDLRVLGSHGGAGRLDLDARRLEEDVDALLRLDLLDELGGNLLPLPGLEELDDLRAVGVDGRAGGEVLGGLVIGRLDLLVG